MADIKALRAWRYDFAVAGRPQTLITPPYDVISPTAQQDYHRANPYNIIHLELGQEFAEDNAQHNRYTRAAAAFADWQARGVLKRDDKPSFYPYVQEFSLHGHNFRRSGFMAALKAGGYENSMVLPHEQTLPGHKEDRYRLMEACRANFSPIFGLYAEPSRSVDHLMAEARKGLKPIFDAVDEAGVRHIMWQVDDSHIVAQVEAALAAHNVYIADGHHRYETASSFASDMAAAGHNGCDRILINLVNLHDLGLVVLPTHRLVRNLEDFSASAFEQAIADAGFAVFRIKDLAGLQECMENSRQGIASFGLYMKGQHYLLNIDREDMLIAAAQPGCSPAYQRLDVSIAHSLILDALCGLGQKELAAGQNVAYYRDSEEAVCLVDEGRYQFALLLNGTHVEEMLAVAEAGEKMPQKSTYFYPKVIAGLLIHKLGE